MDIATIIGLVSAFGMILIGIGGSNLGAFIDPASAMIVIGGTFGVVLVNYPIADVLGAFSVAKNALVVKPLDSKSVITLLLTQATKARKDGILVLQSAIDTVTDPFLKRGLQLAIDGMEPQAITRILETEMNYMRERHELGSEIFINFGTFFPAFGMIGTLIGLVMMLQNMSDPSTIGPAMAIALITTFYGAVMANVVCMPIAGKLKKRSQEEILVKELIMDGILSIAAGDNPRIVETKLFSFLPPKSRESQFS